MAAANGLPIVVGLVLGVLAVLAVAVKIFDLKRKREDQAVQIQAKLSDTLLSDTALAGLPVTPTAYVPLWSASPVTVDVAGQVPTGELRDAALRLIEREMTGGRTDFHIVDRIAVAPSMLRRAA